MNKDKVGWKDWFYGGVVTFVLGCLLSMITGRGEFGPSGFIAFFIASMIAAFKWHDEQIHPD